MTYHQSHINAAAAILKLYKGEIPFHLFIKKYFSANKKFGSSDRKQITSICYSYFRLGKACIKMPFEERALLGTFLCGHSQSDILKILKPQWDKAINKALKEKLAISICPIKIEDIFPFKDLLSKGIDAEKFSESFLIQPDLFLRIRPGFKNRVTGKIAAARIFYKQMQHNCIGLPNTSKIDTIIKLDKEVVVQDYNSQRVGEFFKDFPMANHPLLIWDCCTGSGGKAILAYDIIPNIQLTVSDKRESIIKNLQKRFEKAGIKSYNFFVADLENLNKISPPAAAIIQKQKFDLIICDAPCTGSGTWSRTPEQLFYFHKNQIDKYASLQKKIVENITPFLKPGGHLLYITCSVFKKENEEIVEFIKEKLSLKLQRAEILKGYESKADTMFAALFTALSR